MKTSQVPQSQTHFVRTRDGWRVALHNYARSTKKYPAFLCHGMGSNRNDLDFGVEKSLAKFLYRNGYDVWVIELRGAGDSSKPRPWNRYRYNWCFDDYVQHDLPAAVHYVLRKTGSQGIHWVGHSMGGMLAYPMLGTVDEGTIRTATTVGAPLMTDEKNASLAGFTAKVDWLKYLPFIPQRTLLSLLQPFQGLLVEQALEKMNGLLWNSENMDMDDMIELGKTAVEDLPVPLLRQMREWYLTSTFCSYYRRWNYASHLKNVKTPLHVITGAADGLCPPADCKLAYDIIGSKEKKFSIFGREAGHKVDYGHVDLILGRHASREVFPEILGWMEGYNDR
ncbi:MAG: alpha/beta fold hydrolase [Bdellovibrionota bacterium]